MTITKTILGIVGMDPTDHADPDMKAVLDALQDLNPKPIEACTPSEARAQPTPTDAVKRLLAMAGTAAARPPGLVEVASRDLQIDGATGPLPARVYRPAIEGPLPVILYFHGGGWVLADLDTYDATPRALAAKSHAIVVSAHYRQAPEHKFPAAHDDAIAAWSWTVENAAALGGDPSRIAVMGESAGANLAINVSIHARDNGLQRPVHQALVYPVASSNTTSLSYEENRNARPLNKPMMLWFVDQVTRDKRELQDPRIDVAGSADLRDLPPTAVVIAGIDPLRSDAEHLANRLARNGVEVVSEHYPGATHEFFGMADVVQAARDAQKFVALVQRKAFGETVA